jgi:tetratricopeptide (TPR) repeat protein
LAALTFVGAAACAKKAPPVDEGAPPSGATAPDDAVAPSSGLVAPPTTSPAIALGNLSVQIRSREALVARMPDDIDGAQQLVEFLLTRGQFEGKIADYERADAIAASLAQEHPESSNAHLAHAATLGTFHLFARSLQELDAAERGHGTSVAMAQARASAYMGQGRFDDADALGAWRGSEPHDATELASAAVLAGERGADAESESLFEKARGSYRDVSPFPVAWVDFQRGSLLERKGDRARAKLYFAEAHSVLPTFAHACVHLAALETPERARLLLEPLLGTSDDPEVDASYADTLRRLGRNDEAGPFIARARTRYDELVAKHPEAFADHAASFYLGLGRDPARALDLAKKNADNRRTEAAMDLLMTAALVVGARQEECSAAARGATIRYTTPAFRVILDSARRGCDGSSAASAPP